MDDDEFSPVERERASAFVKAFGKKAAEKDTKVQNRPPLQKEAIPKPQPVAIVVDPSAEEEKPEPKVNIGAEYNAIKLAEEELKALRPGQAHSGRSGIFLAMVVLAAVLALSIYNFFSLQDIKQQQDRLISNEKAIFDKLARLGKRFNR